MTKTSATTAFILLLTSCFSTTANSAPGTFFKSCMYKETLNPDLSVLSDWHVYNVQDVPRNSSCPTPNNPVVYVNGHPETIQISYSHTTNNVDYYTGRTDDGRDCTVKINSFIVAD